MRYTAAAKLRIETEQEADGSWIAEVVDLPGVMLYGATRADAIHAVQALALRVIAERIENGEPVAPELLEAVFAAA